jgi:thioredoxin 1
MNETSDAAFEQDVLRAEGPVIVDFWAPWCKPCKAIEPILEALAAEHGLGLVRLDIDEHLGVPSRYGVLSLPTVIGARPRAHFEREWAAWLTAP